MLLATSRVPHLQVARRAMTANTDLGQLQERCRSFGLPDDGEYFDLIMRVQEHLLQTPTLEGCAVRSLVQAHQLPPRQQLPPSTRTVGGPTRTGGFTGSATCQARFYLVR